MVHVAPLVPDVPPDDHAQPEPPVPPVNVAVHGVPDLYIRINIAPDQPAPPPPPPASPPDHTEPFHHVPPIPSIVPEPATVFAYIIIVQAFPPDPPPAPPVAPDPPPPDPPPLPEGSAPYTVVLTTARAPKANRATILV